MRVLLVGNGGREHALAWRLAQSPLLGTLLIAPGNPGTAALGQNVAVAADDVAGLSELAQRELADVLPHLSEARERRVLPAGEAASILFRTLELARALYHRASRLS